MDYWHASFSFKGVNRKEEEEENFVEHKVDDAHVLVAAKMKQFAADLSKISSDVSSDDEDGNDDVEVIETNVVVSDISGLNEAAAEQISNKLMTTVEALVKCGDIAELFELALR